MRVNIDDDYNNHDIMSCHDIPMARRLSIDYVLSNHQDN